MASIEPINNKVCICGRRLPVRSTTSGRMTEGRKTKKEIIKVKKEPKIKEKKIKPIKEKKIKERNNKVKKLSQKELRQLNYHTFTIKISGNDNEIIYNFNE